MSKIDYSKLLDYIKNNSPILTSKLHEFIEESFEIEKSSIRSTAITRLVNLGLIARDSRYPNSLIRYVAGN